VAGSEAAILDLADIQLEAGSSQTLYLVGTPVEEVPLQPIVVENPVAAAQTAAPAAPGTPVAPGAPVVSTIDMTYYRDTLTAIESRLAEIQAHLEQMQQVEGAQDESSAALERVEEAFALIEDARN